MARYSGPSCRLCRREGQRLYLKGSRCTSPKCAMEKRAFPPGQHGNSKARRPKVSDYGLQLREKQKLRRMYGLTESQFRLTFGRAVRMPGVTGENLLQLLEMRLDNVVYRLGLASSRTEARVMVTHRHVTVNGRVLDIPSCQVRPGDLVSLRARSQRIQPVQMAVNLASGRPSAPWLAVNLGALSGQVLQAPTRDQIDTQVSEHLIVEYYSR